MSSSRVNTFLGYAAKSEWVNLESTIQSLTDQAADQSIVEQLLTNVLPSSKRLGLDAILQDISNPTFLDCLLIFYQEADESSKISIGSCITLLIQKASFSALRKALSLPKVIFITPLLTETSDYLLNQRYSVCEPLYTPLIKKFLNTPPELFHEYTPDVLREIKETLIKRLKSKEHKRELDAIILLGTQPDKIKIELIDKAIKISNQFIPTDKKQEASARFWLPILKKMLQVINASAPNHPHKNEFSNVVHAFLGRLYFLYPNIEDKNRENKNRSEIEKYKQHYKAITSPLANEYPFDNVMLSDFYGTIREDKKSGTDSSDYLIFKRLACLYAAADQKDEKNSRENALELAYPIALSRLDPKSGRLCLEETDDDKINTIQMAMAKLSKIVAKEKINEYDHYLIKRRGETRTWLCCFFGYSDADLRAREEIFNTVQNNKKSLSEKIQVVKEALKNPHIIGGRRQECADILRELQSIYTIEASTKPLKP